MNTINIANGSPRFLRFPPEIRNMIYRLLLCHSTTLGKDQWLRGNPPPQLGAQILRTCRQVYLEALPILYGENTFHIQITNTFGPDYTGNYSIVPRNAFGRRRSTLLPMLKRLSIEVRFTEMHKLSILRDGARELVKDLEKMPNLEFLELDCHLQCDNENSDIMWRDPCWDNYHPEGSEWDCNKMLRAWFGRLRNIKEVVINGMIEEDAEILEKWLKSKDPAEKSSLTFDYETLEELVGHYRFCDEECSNALDAAELDDKVGFDECRAAMIREVKQSWDEFRDAVNIDEDGEKKLE